MQEITDVCAIFKPYLIRTSPVSAQMMNLVHVITSNLKYAFLHSLLFLYFFHSLLVSIRFLPVATSLRSSVVDSKKPPFFVEKKSSHSHNISCPTRNHEPYCCICNCYHVIALFVSMRSSYQNAERICLHKAAYV